MVDKRGATCIHVFIFIELAYSAPGCLFLYQSTLNALWDGVLLFFLILFRMEYSPPRIMYLQ